MIMQFYQVNVWHIALKTWQNHCQHWECSSMNSLEGYELSAMFDLVK